MTLVFGTGLSLNDQVARLEKKVLDYYAVSSHPMRREHFDQFIMSYIAEFNYSHLIIPEHLQLILVEYDYCLALHIYGLTYAAALMAVKKNPHMLGKIPAKYHTDELIKSCPPQYILQGVGRQTKEIKEYVLSQDADCISNVKNPTQSDLLMCYEHISDYTADYCFRQAKRRHMTEIMVYLAMKFSLT